MTQRTFQDPILELATRYGDATDTFRLANEMSNEEAEREIEAYDQMEAALKADDYLARLRAAGHVL
jgi:hypothetical protein